MVGLTCDEFWVSRIVLVIGVLRFQSSYGFNSILPFYLLGWSGFSCVVRVCYGSRLIRPSAVRGLCVLFMDWWAWLLVVCSDLMEIFCVASYLGVQKSRSTKPFPGVGESGFAVVWPKAFPLNSLIGSLDACHTCLSETITASLKSSCLA
ncbi:hypothetical protein DY000_02012282 [Brassica cretica]|uniref:Uncharacterized protein n=1 Tax=Brassica cretica TaxID=69181 RepID=A0ABQ7DBV1_BRACR|nr:hypothetical protein DY000_02012282 [Brassica cretica]